MIVIDKEHPEFQIIDFAIPYDARVDGNEVEKIERYLDLGRELKKVWNMKMKVFQLGVGALVTPGKVLEKRLRATGMETKITELQTTVLTHTNRILRKVLDEWGVLLTP